MGYRVKCIALDLDRTTLDSRGRLPEENRRAIEQALAAGVRVVVVSGRPFGALPEEIAEIPGLTHAITGNGCGVYHLPTGECLLAFQLERESVKQILALCQGKELGVECTVRGQAFAEQRFWDDPVRFGATEKGAGYIRKTRRPVRDIRGFLLAQDERPDVINLVCRTDEQRLALQEELAQAVPGLYMTSSIERLLEISSAESGKHRALKRLLAEWGILPEETAAFGDGDNEAEMLASVGYGIAMADATDACRRAAGYQTISNNEAGVAYAIRNILWEE
ncbi:MAG: HAD family hydrolase [Oscillospiraceae bacterium]|nr:HAD family hydrolase [Oscillospiraceae bacterium]